LAGGSSQLETWDPKPGRPTGGPFKAIPTNVPGVHIGELMPKMAQMMDRVAIVRSLDTRIGDHGSATTLMETGRGNDPGIEYPHIGSVISRELGQVDSDAPNFVSLYLATEGHRRPDPGFFGGSYAAMHLHKSLTPENIHRPGGLSEVDHTSREHLRQLLSERFNRARNAPQVTGYNSSYARVRGLMKSDKLFDIEQESQAVRDRYGPTDFGQHALVGRRLIEAGVPMVKVARAWWDSHADNFRHRARSRDEHAAHGPGRTRPAGIDPGDHPERIRPYADDQQGRRPRPLRQRVVVYLHRRRDSRRHRVRQDG
jgi:hypothetical protein